MVLPECTRRQRSVPALLMLITASTAVGLAQPQVISPRVLATLQQAGGQIAESTAVPVGDDSTVVVVTGTGGDPLNPQLRVGTHALAVKVIGHDPVSRLGFLKVEGGGLPKAVEWAVDAESSAGQDLQAMDPTGPVKCRATGRVKQVGGKILPFSLLGVDFQRAVPPPGTPLVDASGRVVGIVFQATGNGNVGYVIPAEAVHRVRRDVCEGGGKLVRGWLGLALRAETGAPRISRVVENSPAAGAGIRTDDVIVSIGGRAVADYADASNAFFYLIPGQGVRMKIQRASKPLDFTLVPAVTPAP